MDKTFRIAPSILSANFAKLGQEINDVIKSGTDIVHFDVMDNHYVPNLTIGPLVCEAIRPVTDAIIDVHLMVKPVDRIIPDFAKAGANIITFHPEGSEHIDRSLSLVRDSGCKSGLVFNPATPLDYLDHVMDKIDYAKTVLNLPATGAIVQSVSQTKGAIGYIGLAYLNTDVKDIAVSYDAGKTYMNASIENAINGSYPITRPLFFYYDETIDASVKPFVDFILSDKGQTIVKEVGYVPLK